MSLLIVKAVRDLFTSATSVANLLLNLIGGSPTTGQALMFDGSAWAADDIPSGASRTLLSKSADYTVLTGDAEKRIRSTGASAVVLTLPDPSAVSGSAFVFKRAGSGTCTIQRYASETIDGVSASYELASYESRVLVSDGTNWLSFSA